MKLDDVYDFERIYNLIFNQTEEWGFQEGLENIKSLVEDTEKIKKKIIDKTKKKKTAFATMDEDMKKNALYIFIVQLCRDIYD